MLRGLSNVSYDAADPADIHSDQIRRRARTAVVTDPSGNVLGVMDHPHGRARHDV